jgi:hypothetical protein
LNKFSEWILRTPVPNTPEPVLAVVRRSYRLVTVNPNGYSLNNPLSPTD